MVDIGSGDEEEDRKLKIEVIEFSEIAQLL